MVNMITFTIMICHHALSKKHLIVLTLTQLQSHHQTQDHVLHVSVYQRCLVVYTVVNLERSCVQLQLTMRNILWRCISSSFESKNIANSPYKLHNFLVSKFADILC